MKILWFVQQNFDPSRDNGGYNGAGWISSLRNEVTKFTDINLVLSFFSNHRNYSGAHGVEYYSMQTPTISAYKKILYRIRKSPIKEDESLWPLYRREMMKVIEVVKPDIIQIFGTENKLGLIVSETQIPVIVHLQGLVNPIMNAFLPPFVSWENQGYISSIFNRSEKDNWRCLCNSEKKILSSVKYFIGRTDWDKRIIGIYSPKSKYFYGSEILREPFYQEGLNRLIPKRLTIISIISVPQYKGFDLILKTANLLKNSIKVDFVWKVFGNIIPGETEKMLNISHNEVNVEIEGVKTAVQLRDELLKCTVYVQPSYIDNSPNSVCEAQMLGCTCIATYVGGTSSIVEHEKTGFLIPANDPYKAASYIYQLFQDNNLNLMIGENSKKVAMSRHDKIKVTTSLIDVYSTIIKEYSAKK